jgi:hypothetical protein
MLLSDLYLLTVSERAAFIARKLRTRYAKLLATPDWSEVELEQLESDMRKAVLSSIQAKAEVQRRVATAEIIAFPPDTD